MSREKPFLFRFPRIGSASEGHIAVATMKGNFPFDVLRVYWTYGTPGSIERGRHAHWRTEQVLVALAGRIDLHTESVSGAIEEFVLDDPGVGVYLPPLSWHTMRYSADAVQLTLASSIFDENDYIRDYATFKRGRP